MFHLANMHLSQVPLAFIILRVLLEVECQYIYHEYSGTSSRIISRAAQGQFEPRVPVSTATINTTL